MDFTIKKYIYLLVFCLTFLLLGGGDVYAEVIYDCDVGTPPGGTRTGSCVKGDALGTGGITKNGTKVTCTAWVPQPLLYNEWVQCQENGAQPEYHCMSGCTEATTPPTVLPAKLLGRAVLHRLNGQSDYFYGLSCGTGSSYGPPAYSVNWQQSGNSNSTPMFQCYEGYPRYTFEFSSNPSGTISGLPAIGSINIAGIANATPLRWTLNLTDSSGNGVLKQSNGTLTKQGDIYTAEGLNIFSEGSRAWNHLWFEFQETVVPPPPPNVSMSLNISELTIDQAQGFSGGQRTSGKVRNEGGSNWVNPARITITANPQGNLNIDRYYVAFYDKQSGPLIEEAEKEVFLQKIQEKLSNPKAGFLLMYEKNTKTYKAWSQGEWKLIPSNTQPTPICLNNNCLLVANVLYRAAGLDDETVGNSVSWRIQFSQPFGNKTMYTATYVEAGSAKYLKPNY